MWERFLNQISENNRCPAVLIDFPQNRVVLLTAESEAHTKLLRQPGFRNVFVIEFAVQEEVKSSVILLDDFENSENRLAYYSWSSCTLLGTHSTP